ncbi:DUF1287 domain-containing protein [Candidatus Thiothrix sp. Deng01]|uniref:DUF1287 domain-containing protein n=1 Tax=Candidatus Thiothrix phosphatis TaxID=3112415 RepID=A0ABU6CZD0_9GAMM|nr:DUF1287 domain-containing protein [Candidatus Thiothrix sp. Deng01]MEB4592194.1 DUF1287 domain-containing protein [Candidatus Thiothrix sp. Deng01]
MLRRLFWLLLILLFLYFLGEWAYRRFIAPPPIPPVVVVPKPPATQPQPPPVLKPVPPPQVAKMLDSVQKQVEITRSYDPAYVRLRYPNGDVPETTGVCADVIVRAFRAQGVDLQQTLHEDMQRNFSQYPKKWSMKGPDANIDHRRVYNLMTFFKRQGKELPVTHNPTDYQPGDVVAWDLGKGQAHIGIVTQYSTPDGRPLMAHNVGYGANIEDALFFWPVIGHYRYFSKPTPYKLQ